MYLSILPRVRQFCLFIFFLGLYVICFFLPWKKPLGQSSIFAVALLFYINENTSSVSSLTLMSSVAF